MNAAKIHGQDNTRLVVAAFYTIKTSVLIGVQGGWYLLHLIFVFVFVLLQRGQLVFILLINLNVWINFIEYNIELSF